MHHLLCSSVRQGVCVSPQEARLFIGLPGYPVFSATRTLSGLGVAVRALADPTLFRVQ